MSCGCAILIMTRLIAPKCNKKEKWRHSFPHRLAEWLGRMEAMKEDFFAIGNDELEGRPTIKDSKFAVCPNCKKDHAIEYGRKARTHEISKTLRSLNAKMAAHI